MMIELQPVTTVIFLFIFNFGIQSFGHPYLRIDELHNNILAQEICTHVFSKNFLRRIKCMQHDPNAEIGCGLQVAGLL